MVIGLHFCEMSVISDEADIVGIWRQSRAWQLGAPVFLGTECAAKPVVHDFFAPVDILPDGNAAREAAAANHVFQCTWGNVEYSADFSFLE